MTPLGMIRLPHVLLLASCMAAAAAAMCTDGCYIGGCRCNVPFFLCDPDGGTCLQKIACTGTCVIESK